MSGPRQTGKTFLVHQAFGLGVVYDLLDPTTYLDEIHDTARRLLRVHPLRAADALQLAAAVLTVERRPPTLTFVMLVLSSTASWPRLGCV